MSIMKNINKAKVMVLKIRFPTRKARSSAKHWYRMNPSASPYLPSDKGEEISTHESGGDAFVTCLDGTGEITIDGVKYELHEVRIHRHAGKTSACSVWQRAV